MSIDALGSVGRAPRTAWRDGRLLAGRNLLRLGRNPASMASMFVMPLIFLGGFFAVLGRSMEDLGIDYAQHLPPIIVVQSMFFTAISSAFFLAEDRSGGLLERFRSLPMDRWSVMTGRLGADILRAAASMAVVLSGAVVLGFRFRAGLAGAVGFATIALLFALVAVAGCSLVGLTARDAEAATSTLMLPYLPLLMLSTGFVPLEGFPGWIQPFVEWQPVSLTVEALRALSSGGPTTEVVWKALVALVVLGMLLGTLSTRAFRSAG